MLSDIVNGIIKIAGISEPRGTERCVVLTAVAMPTATPPFILPRRYR
jgi:hypothetical protein